MSTDYEEEVQGEEVEDEEFTEDEQEEAQYEVDYIYKHRGSAEKQNLEYFVHWKGYPDSENSWVWAEDMACPELIGDYCDRQEAKKKIKKRGVSMPGPTSTPSAQNAAAATKARVRGKTVTTSVMKELGQSTDPAVPKVPVRSSSTSKQKVPETTEATQKVPPLHLHLPRTSKEPVPAPEQPPLKLKISRSSLSNETKEPTVLAAESPTKRKVAQPEVAQAEQEIQTIQPQISQLRISEGQDTPSLGSTESNEVKEAKETKDGKPEEAPNKVAPLILKKTVKLPVVPPLPTQKKPSMVEKRVSLPGIQGEHSATASRQAAAPSTSALEQMTAPREKTPMPDVSQALQKQPPGPSSAEEIASSSKVSLQESAASFLGQKETTPAPTSQEMEKTRVPENVLPDVEMTPASEVGPAEDETRMETDEPQEAPVEPSHEEDSTDSDSDDDMDELMNMQPRRIKYSERPTRTSAGPAEDEDDEPDTDFSGSDLDTSASEDEEQNDDDITDIEDFQKQEGQETSLRADKKKNGYEKGMKSETLISMVKKGEVISGLVKFEGSNQLDIIPYAKLRLLDPALVASYHVKMLLHRSSSDKPPQEGLIKGLKNREIDSSF